MALPSNVSYTKVTGRFLRAVTDTVGDLDSYPDSDPLEGLSVVFTPSISPNRVKNVSAEPPITIIIDPVTVYTDVEGDIASPSGEKGVWLVSSDDPDLDPYGWTYTVRISGTGFTTVEFAFVAASNAELDIATLLPVPINPGAALLEWQAAVAETDANADRAEAAADEAEAIVASIPTVEGPPGDDGPPGPPGPSAYAVAVSNGFVGTEAEWLTSLEGADGEDGAPGPPGAGLKTYATTAEIDAVTTSEQGIHRFAAGSQDEFFGTAGANLAYWAGDILFTSLVSDNYGSGYPPTNDGIIQQQAEVYDGYKGRFLLSRYRSYNATLSVWQSWSTWSLYPIPNYRPTTDGLWKAGAAPTGSDDNYVSIITPTLTTVDGEATHRMVPEAWTAWFVDASRHALEGGELVHKSSAFEFQGILDSARTDVGTVAFAARSAGVVTQSNRVTITASAAGTGAIAGLYIPIGIAHRPGIIFHATFAMESGATSNTRLLCGLVSAADSALALTDVDPGSMQNFLAAGYSSAESFVSVYQRATGTMTTANSTVAPSTTSNNQLIDFKAFYTPNSGTPRYIMSVRTTGTINRSTGTLSNAPSNSTPLGFFIRASAGGTSATPKVALHRLRIGAGLGAVGGS